jgi:signal transduction histidine kinase/CheY-like chemotaxis protein/HPt (histidine-containing phosphotransfer) domain-containing protein
MKKSPIQLKIGFLMVLAVVLLSAAGYLSYRNISSIVISIQDTLNPESRLLSIREIAMELEKAQNSFRLHSLTNDPADLQPYYAVISGIDRKINRLKSECKNDSLLLKQVETISNLIEGNIYIWNKLLYLNNNSKVVDYLNQLSLKLADDSVNSVNKEKKILKRIFSRNESNQLNGTELRSDLKEIRQQDSITKKNIILRESQLAWTSTKIKRQFYDLISRIEREISEQNEERASIAGDLAEKTYEWLAIFILTGTLLAIIVMFVIVRYVRKTQAYQVALQNSIDESEKLTRTKELFMANISHELRTPVTAISGFAEQLLHEQHDDNTDRTLKIIKSSSDHLAVVINDILDFSKLQNSNMSLEKVHFRLGKIMEDVYTLFEKQASRKNINLSYSVSPDTPPVLLGDPYRLKQIIINLISNSVKFTDNGNVHFNAKSIIKKSSDIELILECTDTGIGIGENKINSIFEDFTQEEMSTTRKYGGTGLGLSIVKKLIELHNGTIECVSKKNVGTRITCHIPYHAGDEKQVKGDLMTPDYIPSEVKHLNILIVDDEEYNRLLFKTILSRWSVKHKTAASSEEAIELLKTYGFDILFMDERMPGTDGLKTTRYIRDELKISESEMPVICISAASVDSDIERYRRAGMNAFLPKPFTEDGLLSAILSVVRNKPLDIVPDFLIENEKKRVATQKINLENLNHIAGGDELFVKQMLLSFIESTKKGMNDLNEAFIQHQWNAISDLSHKMLPPCRHIGATDLCTLLKKIEESTKGNPDKGVLESCIRDATNEFEVISEQVRDHLAKIN